MSPAAPRGSELGGTRPTRFAFTIALKQTIGGAPDALGHLARVYASIYAVDGFNTHA